MRTFSYPAMGADDFLDLGLKTAKDASWHGRSGTSEKSDTATTVLSVNYGK
jgi:hypothetical protein